MICAVRPGESAKIKFVGDDLARIMREKLIGTDWFSREPREYLSERLQRTASVAEGAILQTVRCVALDCGTRYDLEMISVPLRPDHDGTVPVITFFDWNPQNKKAVLRSFQEIIKDPIRAQFIPIVRRDSEKYVRFFPLGGPADGPRAKIVSQAAVRLVINFMRKAMEVHAPAGLDPTDYLIAITIDNHNLSHIASDPDISLRYAGCNEPSWMRQGISRAAVSRITHIPTETVRRRINRLIDKGVLVERKDGIVLSAGNRSDIAPPLGKVHFTAALVEQLVAELRVRGIALH